MDFGRLEDSQLPDLDIKHPPIEGLPNPVFISRLQVGCPLWGSDFFKGTLYPKGVKKSEYLRSYAEALDVLELNVTYHSIPDEDQVLAWREEVSVNPRFKFYPKLPRVISHEGRIDHHFELLMRFISAVKKFGPHLGTCFLQLPPSFTPSRLHELVGFLELWPRELKLALEVRHLVWFKNREVSDTLRNLLMKHDVSWVITDTPGIQDVVHQTMTNAEVMVRFVTTGFHEKDKERMMLWSEHFTKYADAGVSDIVFFVHERDEWLCRDILEFMIELNPDLVTRELPKIEKESEQLSLI